MSNDINLGIILGRLHKAQALQTDFLLEAKRRQIVKEIVDGKDLNLWEHEEDEWRERIDAEINRRNCSDADC